MSPTLVLCLTCVIFLGVVECLADDDDGERQVTPAVRFVRCSFIRNTLRNGRVKLRSRGRIAKFQCNQGYDLVGKRFSTCLLGKWNNPVPICVAKGCPHREAPPNGNVLHLYTGAVLLYTCLPGYVLHGSPSVHCDGRKWNDSIPTCEVASTDPAPSCDFEDPNICGWTHDPSHDFDWKRHQFATPSGHVGTGPSYDHTLGAGQAGFYMYTEASSPRQENDTARLFSPVYSPNQGSGCFVFWYHMYGVTIGIMRVYIKQEGQVFQELTPVWSMAGDQGNQWFRGAIPVPEMRHNFQIVVEGLRGRNYVGDSAIDDVSLRQTECQPEEPSNVTDSCQTRCGATGDGSTVTCSCDDDCEMNSTCCNDYWDTCVGLGKKNSSNVLPENENDEDNNIPISYSETESTIQETNTTTTVPITQANVTNTPTTTTTLPTTKAMVTTTSTLPTTKVMVATTSATTTLPTTTVIITTTSTTMKIIPTTPLMTNTVEDNATNTQSESPSFFTTPFEDAAIPDYEMPITDDNFITTGQPDDDNAPFTTDHPLQTDLLDVEGVPPVTTSSHTLTQGSPTEDSMREKGSSESAGTTETTTNVMSITTRIVPTPDNTTVLVRIQTSARIPEENSSTPEVLQGDQESKTDIKPNSDTKTPTTSTTILPTIVSTASNPSSTKTTSKDSPFKSIPPEEAGENNQIPVDEEDERVTPAKWGVSSDSSGLRPKKEKPSTGFASEKKPNEARPNYIVLGVGSVAGVLAVGLLVGIVLYLVIRRRGKPKQNNLEDDSEIRYLSQSEVVEMSIPEPS